MVQNDIDNGFTSAQLAIIKDGQMVYSNAWGTVNAYNPDGTPKTDSPAVTTDTLYDLASNTKMYATNYAIQYLVANSKNYNNFSINAPITKYFPDFVNNTIEIKYETSNGTGAPDLETAKAWKAELTVADILQHQAGFAPDPQFHNDKFNQVTQKPDPDTDNVLYAIGKDKVAEAICKAPLVYEPGTKTVYSDVDYMLLGLIIEQVTGKDLNTFLKETFWQPMGLDHITYNPLNNGFTANDCAATELNGNSRDGAISFTGNRTGTIQGQVHDEKAWYAMGGVSGHAGLFANAEDLATLAQMMLNPSGYGTNRLFSTNVNEYFTSRKNSSATWGQGWWRQADCGRPWYFGVQASRNTIGHQGWTGTLTAIDPEQDLVVVYLTNKINSPVTDNTVNANQFDGNWYTASTLGFVTNILYQGITANSAADDIQPALDALLGDMAVDKLRLVADEKTDDPTHPIVRSAYSVVDLVFDAAEARRTSDNIAAARAALSGLDAARDAAVYSSYQDRLTVLEPPATTPDYNNPSDEKPEWENPYSDVSDSYWAYDAIRFVSEENLFQGVTGGGFAPEMTMSRAMLATVLYRAAGSPAVTASAGFTDVPAGKWYSDAVNWAASKGIVKGVGGNRFAPDDNVSREQIATILYQYVLSTGETAKADASVLAVYGDNASVSSWAADGMAWAVKEGIITGKPGSLLAPADSATRAEVATMLMRFLGK
ncbi:MAG: penicillin binding protein PBP4B [Pseudoflavonifractor capillosus]|nr:penicillin binding protein PBP4B [Pseudoflavonifractor capillosus]